MDPSYSGGVMAPADVRGAGIQQWAETSGILPTNPVVGGPEYSGYGVGDADRGRARIVTTPEGQIGPATGGVMAPADAAAMANWRDLFNFRGSPMPWLLIAGLIVLGFMDFRVQARAKGVGGGSLALG
jgi:hypothetical protein